MAAAEKPARKRTTKVCITVLVDDLGQYTIGDPQTEGDDPWGIHTDCHSGWSSLRCFNLELTLPVAAPGAELRAKAPRLLRAGDEPATLTIEAAP